MSVHYKNPVSVLVVIHTPDLQVLLIERADFPDGWQSVTGSVETGEQADKAAWREVAEETGIVSGELSDWQQQNHWEIYERWRYRYAPGVTHNTEHVFSLSVPAPLPPVLAEREHTAFVWLPWQQAADKVFSPSNADAIRALPQRHTR